MAISRMQQPRQLYGLGSFVKKVTKKITKPVTKLAGKIVPKEIAGIMRAAAPFLPPGYREAAYLLGTAKQTGRISPMDLALTAAPTFFASEKFGGKQLADRFKQTSIGKGLFGTPRSVEFMEFQDIPGQVVRSVPGEGAFPPTVVQDFGGLRAGQNVVTEATQGILGRGGKMFQFGDGKGLGAFRDDTKLGQFLLGGTDKSGKPTGKFDTSKLMGIGIGTLSLIQSASTPEEAGQRLADSTGNPMDRERGEQLFGLLNSEIFKIDDRFVLPAKDGGLMRKNFALGTSPTDQEQGLGGLPIEADMRYTGGFMPYGEKEKADDVPARLSKNEFVFTADAVRAAGGGSVQKGAQKMYNTMKALESKPEARGMA
jgi:hypothetical protein